MVEGLKLNCGEVMVPDLTRTLQSQKDPEVVERGKVVKLEKSVKCFCLHFAAPNLAALREGPSPTPRQIDFIKGVALEDKRRQVWAKKGSLAEGCNHPQHSYSKRSQEENNLFFSWCHCQVAFQTHFV